MSQIKIHGRKERLRRVRQPISDAIHACVVETLGLPPDKRFHRFLALDEEMFVFPADRSDRYTIIEISMFEGRSVETKRRLIHLLFERLASEVGIEPQDIEITIFETPRHNWGIRGTTGDQLALAYAVSV